MPVQRTVAGASGQYLPANNQSVTEHRRQEDTEQKNYWGKERNQVPSIKQTVFGTSHMLKNLKVELDGANTLCLLYKPWGDESEEASAGGQTSRRIS